MKRETTNRPLADAKRKPIAGAVETDKKRTENETNNNNKIEEKYEEEKEQKRRIKCRMWKTRNRKNILCPKNRSINYAEWGLIRFHFSIRKSKEE